MKEQRADSRDYYREDRELRRGLVSADWLKAVLERGAGERWVGDGSVVVVEAYCGSVGGGLAVGEGLIPGSIPLDTELFEDGYPTWRLRGESELAGVIGGLGIACGTLVVVSSRWLLAAARVWWILKYAGVADVRILAGGAHGWAAAGYGLESRIRARQPVEYQGSFARSWLATTADVRWGVETGVMRLVDVRSGAEHRGEISGYGYVDAMGRIPGSVRAGYGMGVDGRGGWDVGSWLRRWHAGEGGMSGRCLEGACGGELVFYCGGGWRSSLACFHAWMLGFEGIRNYSDGWCGWSTEYVRDPGVGGGTPGWRQECAGNPVEVG